MVQTTQTPSAKLDADDTTGARILDPTAKALSEVPASAGLEDQAQFDEGPEQRTEDRTATNVQDMSSGRQFLGSGGPRGRNWLPSYSAATSKLSLSMRKNDKRRPPPKKMDPSIASRQSVLPRPGSSEFRTIPNPDRCSAADHSTTRTLILPQFR